MSGFYYQLFQEAPLFILSLPYLVAIPIFLIAYSNVFLRHTARIRTRTLIKAQTSWLKYIAIALFLLLVPVIAFGNFSNDFVRILILCTCYAYTYYAELHWIIRVIVSMFSYCSKNSDYFRVSFFTYSYCLFSKPTSTENT